MTLKEHGKADFRARNGYYIAVILFISISSTPDLLEVPFMGPSLQRFSAFSPVLAGAGRTSLKITSNHNPDLIFFLLLGNRSAICSSRHSIWQIAQPFAAQDLFARKSQALNPEC